MYGIRLALIVTTGMILGSATEVRAVGKGARAPKKAPTDLEKALVEVAREGYTQCLQEVQVGKSAPKEEMFRWSHRWLDAQRALSDKKADQVAAYQGHRDRMKEMEKVLKKYFDAGTIATKDYKAGQYRYLQAEIWLARIRSEK
jgi:hypothetical protein